MKILHVINTLSSGGAERHLLALAAGQRDRGAEVAVAFLRERVQGAASLKSDFAARGIALTDLRAASRYDLRAPSGLARLAGRLRPDVLHTHQPRADFAGLLARRACPEAVWISSVHDLHDVSWSAGRLLPLLGRVWRRPDAVIAISGAVKDWLEQRHRVRGERIRVIEYGIETEPFERPLRDLRAERGWSAAPVIGSIGRLEPRKGHDILIRSMPAVLAVRSDARLVIAGHDPDGYGGTLRRLIEGLRLELSVTLAGFERDVPSFLRAVDVFAFASRSEGFGQVVVEAMAASRPVVASDVAPLNGIVEPGVTGLLARPDDPGDMARAVLMLLARPDAGREMGRRGALRVRERFSAARMAGETLDLYRSLGAGSRSTDTECSEYVPSAQVTLAGRRRA